MAENRRAPGADVINQFISVHVPDFATGGAIDKKRIAADRAKCAHRRIDAAGNIFNASVKSFLDFARFTRNNFNRQGVKTQIRTKIIRG